MADTLSESERDDLVRRIIEADDQRFPDPSAPDISQDEYDRLSERFYVAVGEYFDRLPRVIMSACPWCGAPLERAFDPWGVDGPWWGVDSICKLSEPEPCEHFRVLLGALRLDDAAVPARVVMDSQPGPEVPFVVPSLLALPNMTAVVARLPMQRGGPAFPIGYYSDTPMEPGSLHQPWRRTMLWYERDGKMAWTTKNYTWDFDLDPWLRSGQLCWVLLDADETPPTVHRLADGAAAYPFGGLAGERRPQLVSDGVRDFLELPDGTPLNPFEEEGGTG